MRAWKRILLVPAAAGLAAFLQAQSPEDAGRTRPGRALVFSFNGTCRLRGEAQDGFNIRTYGTGTREDYLLSRLRLEIDLRWRSLLRVHVQVQDARALGPSFSDEDFAGGNNPFHDAFDINQLYLEVRPARRIAIKVGRQAIS